MHTEEIPSLITCKLYQQLLYLIVFLLTPNDKLLMHLYRKLSKDLISSLRNLNPIGAQLPSKTTADFVKQTSK